MKKTVTRILFLLSFSLNLYATDYYVSNGGNDSLNGLTPDSAWATIEKVVSSKDIFNNGDRILFERGDVFRGTISFRPHGITFADYGIGDKPVLSGFQEVTGWIQYSGNIWMTDLNAESVRLLMIDTLSQPLGRYPNDSWLFYDSGIGSSGIVDNDLGFADNYWQGGQCAVRVCRWIIDAMEITSQTSTEINFAGETTYGLEAGWGYFFQNHPNALDLEGEWCFVDSTLYIYSTTDPNLMKIKVSAINRGFTQGYISDVTFQNLKFEGFNEIGININCCSSSNILIDNCDFENIGIDAVRAEYVTGFTVTNCTFKDILNSGVVYSYAENTNISNNNFTNIGMIAGRGANDNGTYRAITLSRGEGGHLISNNNVINVGYNGISFSVTNNVNVINNYLDGACMVKDDGGGIYTWSKTFDADSGHIIRGNIVHNVYGNNDGVKGATGKMGAAYAIYIDDRKDNIQIEDNTMFDSYTGLFIHNSRNIKINNNTIYNCERGLLMRSHRGYLIAGCDVTNNIIVNMHDSIDVNTQYSLKPWWNRDSGPSAGIPDNNEFDYNHYICPFSDDKYIYMSDSYNSYRYSFDEWQTNENEDLNSKESPVKWSESTGVTKEDFVMFDYTTVDSKVISLSDTYLDADSNLVSGDLTVQPYSSIVLQFYAKGDITEVGKNRTTPFSFQLSQNYPNPFNPKTVICYSLPVTSHIKLSIYNVLGQKVATLVNKQQPAGKYVVKFDASHLASGVYFYQLKIANGFEKIKKMFLMK